MWLPDKAFQLFEISHKSFDELREKLAELRAERDSLKAENSRLQVQSDWFRVKVNQLELERAQLIEKAYPGLKVPVPEIARQPTMVPELGSNIFDDMGDPAAKVLGYPVYNSPFENTK